ncbi:RNA polymerase sigma factor [Egicoccus halophilus]|uniref:RNA polymerase sigma factor n=1 Tax=Egicoccus halophilus TaxID=1670830 RepID=A0A8J3ACF6_9ACTN|nr:sigma-70 family RNA polymerase sigma factor [Egicoccus halophilus]GGI08600.1 RNA polymerase sigma factor [Egicoccus halophilus]
MDRAAVEVLVRSAAAGDQDAFDELVARYSGLVWAVVRAHRLGDADAQDVFQTTWLRLVEHLDRLRDPRAVGGWLATTARHESLRLLRAADRTRPVAADELDLADESRPASDAGLLGDEQRAVVWAAFDQLGERCRGLLRLLMADPTPSYEEVGAALDMPIGSIGPTRGRCLGQLREHLRTRGITPSTRYSG